MKISNGVKEVIRKLIPVFVLDWYHFLLALFGAVFYGFPSRQLKIIGVTGTSGKTTVVDLTTKILEESGYKTASLSSIKFKIGEKEWENNLKMTMPGRFKIQKFMRQAVKEGCEYAVLEVTSEGIKQYRHKFIDFAVAVFTNLSPEHIEAHGGFENYRNAKLKLFKATKNIHIINLDDENAKYFLDIPAKEQWGYQIKIKIQKSKATLRGVPLADSKNQNSKIIEAENIYIESSGISFMINKVFFLLNLLGEFNVYNTLAAICVGLSQETSLETCKRALEKVKGMPGRMEVVFKEPFTVIVDYAITPVALEKVYKALTANKKNKPICVLGACGGGRDKWKRPVLGKIAAKYCEEIIMTNEDPYDEPPLKIMEEIASGINTQHPTLNTQYLILDRRDAIKKALELARSGDTVIITGKGCEPWMCVAKGKKIPWDDRQVVREEFEKATLRGVRSTFRGTKKYEVLSHRADLKIRVFGRDKEELFKNALLAMAEELKPKIDFSMPTQKETIKIKSPDLGALLVDFLSEVLYLVQTNKEIYHDVKFKKFTDTPHQNKFGMGQAEIEAELTGQKVERFGEDIKAVTYHDLDIHQREDGSWEAIVLFDI